MADLKQRLAPLEGIDMPDRWSEIRHRAPRAGFDPEPPRRQPIAAAALAVVLTVVTVAWLATAFRSDGTDVAVPPGWTTRDVPSLGLTMRHPSGWTVAPIDEQVGHLTLFGAAFTNVPVELVHPELGRDSVTSEWDMRELPTGAVAVIATSYEGGPVDDPGRLVPEEPSPGAPLDISLADAEPMNAYAGDAIGQVVSVPLGERTVRFEVWFGSGATQEDREIAEEILSSARILVEPLPSEPGEPTDEPDSSPTLDPRAVDLGLGFGICDADQITGAFGTGGSTRVWFGTRTNEETLRCSSSSRRFAIAVDIGGDRNAEAWIDPIGPNVCFLDCGLVGVVDLDGDGTDELVLLLEGSVTPNFGVVDVRPDGGLRVMGYVDGNAPQGVPGDGPAKLTIGGDEAYSYAVSCEVDASGPLITQRAVAGVVDAPELRARVATYSLRLTPEGFVVVADEVQEGVVPPPSLPLESSLCGLKLPPLGMP